MARSPAWRQISARTMPSKPPGCRSTAMSEENVEIVRQVYATGCWNSEHDPTAALPYLADEEFEFANPAHAVVPGTRHGHDGFIKAMRSATEALSFWHHEPLG